MHAFSFENVGCSLTGGLLKGTVFKTPKIDANPQKFFSVECIHWPRRSEFSTKTVYE